MGLNRERFMDVEDHISVGKHQSSLTSEFQKDELYRILSLDGGGAKGFYRSA